MMTLSRRNLVYAGVGALAPAGVALPGRLQATENLPLLRATTRTLDIDGRPATVLGLLRDGGGHGIILQPGERFALRMRNEMAEPTIIHWHGQIPPIEQDGVPDAPLPKLRPGETRDFDYAAYPGTHWMHAHIPDQEMRLLAAPLIVRSAADASADRQEVVLLLHDFSFTPLAELLVRLAAPAAANPHAGMAGMAGMAMDLNDIDFDAYLANDRTLNDPEVVRVQPGAEVLLRVINAAAATVFRLDTGSLAASLVAVDGQPVVPAAAQDFALSMGQRADLLLRIPTAGGGFPILALREGARERSGLILATPGATIRRISPLGEREAAPYSAAQEAALRASRPLPVRTPDRRIGVTLDGTMTPYVWSIDGRPWGTHRALSVRRGERVELSMDNKTMMAHPMHLHGHHFQVVETDGRRIEGAIRDTVQVPAMARVTVAFDGGDAAGWMFHCHHMLHLAAGMMTQVDVAT